MKGKVSSFLIYFEILFVDKPEIDNLTDLEVRASVSVNDHNRFTEKFVLVNVGYRNRVTSHLH